MPTADEHKRGKKEKIKIVKGSEISILGRNIDDEKDEKEGAQVFLH